MSSVWDLTPLLPGADHSGDIAWKEGLLVLDTNVLLNLYRVPLNTRDEALTVLEACSSRLWLPHQVASEYLRNRPSVIQEQFTMFSTVGRVVAKGCDGLENAIKALNLDSRHSLVDPTGFLSSLKDARARFDEQLATWEGLLDVTVDRDPIWERLRGILESRTGQPPSQSRLQEIPREGERRFSLGIPPGHKDSDKKDELGEGFDLEGALIERQFGDLAIWFEILDQIESRSLSAVVFVTEETKEDWWAGPRGKRSGPQPSLIYEAGSKCPNFKALVLTSTSQFLKIIGKHYKTKITPAAIKQVEDVARQEREKVSSLGPDQRYFVEAALRRWLASSGRFIEVELNAGFPDVLAVESSTNRTVGVELKYLSQPFDYHIHPILAQIQARGHKAVEMGLVDRVDLVIAVPSRQAAIEVRKGITRYLRRQSLNFAIIICTVAVEPDGEFTFVEVE